MRVSTATPPALYHECCDGHHRQIARPSHLSIHNFEHADSFRECRCENVETILYRKMLPNLNQNLLPTIPFARQFLNVSSIRFPDPRLFLEVSHLLSNLRRCQLLHRRQPL